MTKPFSFLEKFGASVHDVVEEDREQPMIKPTTSLDMDLEEDIEQPMINPSSPDIDHPISSPDIRAVIDKVASYAAKHGPEFEKRILADVVFVDEPVKKINFFDYISSFLRRGKSSGRFDFMMLSHPDNAYYHHKVMEIRDQLSYKERFLPDTFGRWKSMIDAL